MKKTSKKKLVIGMAIVIGLVVVYFLLTGLIGRQPFKTYSVDMIQSVTVRALPPDTTEELSQEEIAEFVSILQTVRTYNMSWGYKISGGQNCIFTVTFTDGAITEINATNPYMIINGRGYKTEYEPCELLNQLANRVCNTQFAN